MSKYLVKLKPIEAFFFGGEKVFEFYKKGEELENNIIKSREFPQQTSILGMIRKEILVLNNCIKENRNYKSYEREKNNTLIGAKSFNIQDENEDFGVINGISPVFIIEETEGKDRFLIKIPKDHNKNTNSKEYTHLKFNDDKGNCLKVKTNFSKEVYLPIDFNAKDGLSEDFIDIETGNIIKNDKIFIRDCSIGIKLDEKHITQENSLFRLEKYKFNYDKDYEKGNKCFAFILDIKDEGEKNTFENYRNVVTLGGEGSHFLMTFEKVSFDIKDKINFSNKQNNNFNIQEKIYLKKECVVDTKKIYKIILLSDTYISKDVYEQYCNYSISKKLDFKSLQSENYHNNLHKHYYRRFKKNDSKFSLLEKGSVLFTDKDNYHKLVENINNSKFQKIGYNIYI